MNHSRLRVLEIKAGSNSETVIEFPNMGHEAAGLPNCKIIENIFFNLLIK